MDSTQAFVLHYGKRELCPRCRELAVLLVTMVTLDGDLANALVYCVNCDLSGPSPLLAALPEPASLSRPRRWPARLVAQLKRMARFVRLRQR